MTRESEALSNGQASGNLVATLSRSERLQHAASKQPELAEDLLAVDPIVFNWGIFIRQTLYHALAPFTAPIVYYFESPVMARNQGFTGLTYVGRALRLCRSVV